MDGASSEASRLIGAVLWGRFRLDRLLGEGGVGIVYEATVLATGLKVAIKVLRPEFHHNEDIVRRFFEEAAVSAKLNHPNIIQIHEAGRAEDGTPCLVMELLVGRPLSAALEVSGAVPLTFAIFVLQSALEALDFAHKQGVVHRDLKPDNLFVVNDSLGTPSIKLVDFGIAKVMDLAGGIGARTRTGALLGTPAYMSPEQLIDPRRVDPRTDLWSMAIIFYEMLAAQDPFPAENPMEQIHLLLSASPTPIAEIKPELAPLQPFFDRALARNVEERFSSAQEMVATMRYLPEVQSKLVQEPVLATASSSSQVQRGQEMDFSLVQQDQPSVSDSASDRSPLVILLVILALLLLIVGVVGLWYLYA